MVEVLDSAEYLTSNRVSAGLAAAKAIWSVPGVFRLSGLYIYMSEMAIPALMAIERRNSLRFESIQSFQATLQTTGEFLRTVVGLSKEEQLFGGIMNLQVVSRLHHYGSSHTTLPGVSSWMMAYIAHIITIAPIKVAGLATAEQLVQEYFEYMQHAWLIMGVHVTHAGTPIRTNRGIPVEALARPSRILGRKLHILRTAYAVLYGEDNVKLMWDQILELVEPNIARAVTSSLRPRGK